MAAVACACRAAPRLLAYVGGILVAYLGLGVAMMLGLDAMRGPLAVVFAHPFALAAQALLGAGLLAYALFAPSKGQAPAAPPCPATDSWPPTSCSACP